MVKERKRGSLRRRLFGLQTVSMFPSEWLKSGPLIATPSKNTMRRASLALS